jgi:hypothetical protein
VPATGLTFTYARVSGLTGADLDSLWRVYSSFFETERASFDLAVGRADEVLRYRDAADGRLCGMALLSAYPATYEGRAFRVFSTGAVCLEPAYRGLNAVQRAGLFRLARERLRHPFSNVYWYFDTFSYKSYLLLSRNLAEYWPRRDSPTPAWERGVIDLLARRHGGDAWNPKGGVIRAQGRRLRPGVAFPVPDAPDPNLRYFLDRNPGHAEGDRLPCLCPLNARNVAAIAWTALYRGLRRAFHPATPSAT